MTRHLILAPHLYLDFAYDEEAKYSHFSVRIVDIGSKTSSELRSPLQFADEQLAEAIGRHIAQRRASRAPLNEEQFQMHCLRYHHNTYYLYTLLHDQHLRGFAITLQEWYARRFLESMTVLVAKAGVKSFSRAAENQLSSQVANTIIGLATVFEGGAGET